MTELTTYLGGTEPQPSALAVWANDARQAAAVAQSLAPTPFVPASLRGKDDRTTIGNITAAILTGAELGLTPMAALRSIVVIQGTPALTAVAMRGVVQAHGHQVWVESSSDTRAVVCGQRVGTEHVDRAVWTWERATKLGLTTKDNWRKQPEAMLIARGTSQVCRQIGADALLGLPYSAEEMADEKPERPTTARRRALEPAPPMPEPELVATEPAAERSEPVAEPALEPPDDSLTPKQLTALNAGLTALGYTDRGDKLAYLSKEVGRDVDSSANLTRGEASRLIDLIKQREVQPAAPDQWEPPADWQPTPEATAGAR